MRHNLLYSLRYRWLYLMCFIEVRTARDRLVFNVILYRIYPNLLFNYWKIYVEYTLQVDKFQETRTFSNPISVYLPGQFRSRSVRFSFGCVRFCFIISKMAPRHNCLVSAGCGWCGGSSGTDSRRSVPAPTQACLPLHPYSPLRLISLKSWPLRSPGS